MPPVTDSQRRDLVAASSRGGEPAITRRSADRRGELLVRLRAEHDPALRDLAA
jgi:hypothetical protein